jgi:peptidyl-prolyl cis-trans isomerase SurA
MKPTALLTLPLLLAACRSSPPAGVAATVNSRPITYAELDKQYLLQFGSQPSGADDQTLIQKLEVLRSLIDSEIMLQRAEKAGLMATDADVQAKLNELKAPYTEQEFQKQLQARKMTLDELRAQLRRELSIQKLINKEITSHITITDQDVAAYYNANKNLFNLPEPQYHLAQILVTPGPDANLRNLKNDNALTPEQARAKIQMIEQRLKANEDFAVLAQNYSEDPQSAPNGGDLGFIPESALAKADPALLAMFNSMQPGQISPIINTPEGFRIFKLISKEPAGQRELSDPAVQQNIRDTLLNRKDQLLRASYYEVARNEAEIVNYFARRILEERTKK